MSAIEDSDRLWAAEPAPEAVGVAMADWWRRFAALVIEIAVMWIPPAFLTRDMDKIPGFFVGIAAGVWPLWDGHRQAVHDKLAGSMVVSAT